MEYPGWEEEGKWSNSQSGRRKNQERMLSQKPERVFLEKNEMICCAGC